ncbi:hypothetical protein [Mesorhizobium sp. M0698]|uniref:hypothetical protein n=1 Tax=Mesorhizobium sp. M0698 TaxID=2956987 RepID=UPI00333964BB
MDADANALAIDELFGAAARVYERPVDAFAVDQLLAGQTFTAGIDDDRRQLGLIGIRTGGRDEIVGLRIKGALYAGEILRIRIDGRD